MLLLNNYILFPLLKQKLQQRIKHINRKKSACFSRERKKYYKHQEKARKRPNKYLSIITDGMDQSKTNIPHFRIPSKVCI